MPLKALIFDVDGTLAETEEAHRAAFNQAFAAHGLDWHWDQASYGRLLAVTGGKERIRSWVDSLSDASRIDDSTIRALHRDKTDAFVDIVASGMAPRQGIDALIAQGRAIGCALAIATTTTRANVDALGLALWQCDVTEVFPIIAAGDEVPRKKPAPDVYRLALERLGLDAADAVAFEDSANGVAAAKAAGVRVIASPSLYTRVEELGDADLVVDEFLDPAVGDYLFGLGLTKRAEFAVNSGF